MLLDDSPSDMDLFVEEEIGRCYIACAIISGFPSSL